MRRSACVGDWRNMPFLIIACLALLTDLVATVPQSSPVTPVPSHEAASSWTLSTDDTLLKVSVEHGRPTLRALGSKVRSDSWLQGPLKERLMETVKVDGTVVQTDWKFKGADL